ncbi:MAG: ATP-binding cassette domain-containing protein [Sulfitobacter sp.]|nr:ATP-binding cassette domain-containing protein [Sulfitobacter sp.]
MRLIAADLSVGFKLRGVVTTLLDRVSLEVQPGEIVGIAGPSGSGKTTLLSTLGGLTRPLSGSVTVTGTAGTYSPPFAPAMVSWVFQGANVMPHRTAVENVAVGAMACGAHPSVAEVDALELMGRLGLGHLVERRARTVSGGEAQRIAIARALASRSHFVLADEPTAHLDLATGRSALRALGELAMERRTSLLIATHDPEVKEICTRILQCGPNAEWR